MTIFGIDSKRLMLSGFSAASVGILYFARLGYEDFQNGKSKVEYAISQIKVVLGR